MISIWMKVTLKSGWFRSVEVFFVLACVLVVGAPLLWAGQLQVGRGKVKITPGPGIPMAGQYGVRLNEGVHDDLYAKAIMLEKDGVKAALVVCDLASIPRSIVEEARRLAEDTTGLRGDHLMISATHTHTGPTTGSRLIGVDSKTERIAKAYLKALPGMIAESVRLAEADLQSARVSAAIGHEDSVAFIRRFLMKDGTVGWNSGRLNPKIVRPLGEIDPAVPVVYFDTPDSQPLATYVNYANHLDTVGGLRFSADYPYTIAKLLGEVKGPDMLTVFTIGTAGNVNHLDVKSPVLQSGHYEAARIGTILAGEVLRTYRKLEPLEVEALQVSHEIVELPLASIRPGDPEWARKIVTKYGTSDAAPFYDQVYAFKVLDVDKRQGKPIEAEVQVISLGGQIAWVGLPGEIFVELGKAIKIGSPFSYTIVAELANGSINYVPDRRAYPQGAYEVISARVALGSGEALVEAAIRLLIDHHSKFLK